MNIFEALNEGKGRATLPEKSQYYVAMYITSDLRYNFVWSHDLLHGVFDIELRSNDWIPYVPPEERKTIETATGLLQSIYKPFLDDYKKRMAAEANVPRGTCSNCGQVITPKVERKVIVRVKWETVKGQTIVYPVFQDSVDYQCFPSKPEMKMTLEWEE